MQLHVRVLPAGPEERVELQDAATGTRLLEALNLNQEAHVLLRDDLPIPADARLREGDELTIVSVISGG